MRAKRKKKLPTVRYIPLKEIEKIDDEFLTEINKVRTRLNGCSDSELVNTFYSVLLSGYNAAIEIKARECEIDYAIKAAEIEARAEELRPVRYRHWYWLFKTFPNRAQDIIEERAELEAERIHSELEKLLDDGWKQLQESDDKQSKRELKRQKKEQRKAKKATIDEATAEPPANEPTNAPPAAPANVQTAQENASTPAKQLPGQMTLDDVQAQEQTRPVVPFTSARPRPPKSLRK